MITLIIMTEFLTSRSIPMVIAQVLVFLVLMAGSIEFPFAFWVASVILTLILLFICAHDTLRKYS